MSPFLRLKWRTATWLANAEPVVGQVRPTSTSGPFAVITQGLAMPLVSQNLSVTDQGCEVAVWGRFREGSGWASKLIFLLSSFVNVGF